MSKPRGSVSRQSSLKLRTIFVHAVDADRREVIIERAKVALVSRGTGRGPRVLNGLKCLIEGLSRGQVDELIHA